MISYPFYNTNYEAERERERERAAVHIQGIVVPRLIIVPTPSMPKHVDEFNSIIRIKFQ